jgi:hypothetical protein
VLEQARLVWCGRHYVFEWRSAEKQLYRPENSSLGELKAVVGGVVNLTSRVVGLFGVLEEQRLYVLPPKRALLD